MLVCEGRNDMLSCAKYVMRLESCEEGNYGFWCDMDGNRHRIKYPKAAIEARGNISVYINEMDMGFKCDRICVRRIYRSMYSITAYCNEIEITVSGTYIDRIILEDL